MDYHVLEARYVGGHVVWLRFGDGTEGEIDLGPALRGPIFEALRDEAFFKRFAIHPEFHTLVWPNGADFAPEFLHDITCESPPDSALRATVGHARDVSIPGDVRRSSVGRVALDSRRTAAKTGWPTNHRRRCNPVDVAHASQPAIAARASL